MRGCEIVSREIAAARARSSACNNRANFADVSVSLVASRADRRGWRRLDAGGRFDDALRVLEVAAGVLLIAAAVLLPLR